MLGTPAFMAPEQALGRSADIDAQTDLWAVGATLFKMLTGRYVHEANTMNEQLVQAATKPAPPLLSVLPHAPHELAQVVDRALAFHKADRFAHAQEMQEAIFPLLGANDMAAHPLITPTSLPMFSPVPQPSGMRSPSVLSSASTRSPMPAVLSSASTRSPVPAASLVTPAGPTGTNVVTEVSRPPGIMPSHASRWILLAAAVAIVVAVGVVFLRGSGTAPSVDSQARPAGGPAPAAGPAPADSPLSSPLTTRVPSEAASTIASDAASVVKTTASAEPRPLPGKPSDEKPRKRPSNKPVADDEDPFGRRH
jgi:serine/threonine-protein kinase